MRSEYLALKARSSEEVARLTKALEQAQTHIAGLTQEMQSERESGSHLRVELANALERLSMLKEQEAKLREQVRRLKDDSAHEKAQVRSRGLLLPWFTCTGGGAAQRAQQRAERGCTLAQGARCPQGALR